MSAFLSAALAYAADGHPVLPLHEGQKTPCLRRWQDRATTDARTIESWWTTHGYGAAQRNVGILTGDRADYKLAVLDVDVKHGGSIPDWAPPTLTAHTPTGGYHLYYSVPVDSRVRNAVNIGGAAAPGLDVRADQGYVVAPPSVLDVPRPYHWAAATPWETATIAAIDPALLLPVHMTSPELGARQRRFEWRDEVPVGERNAYLTSLAGHLYASGEDETGVLGELQRESDRLGFTPRADEVAKIARSVARYH